MYPMYIWLQCSAVETYVRQPFLVNNFEYNYLF